MKSCETNEPEIQIEKKKKISNNKIKNLILNHLNELEF